MKEEVLIAGFGGQGILLMGQLLANAAMIEGYYATWFPSYGPEMRGGTANCTTVFADEEIGSPIAANYDVVVAMNQPSLERFAPRVRPDGCLLVNATMVPVRCGRIDIQVAYIDAGRIARRLGDERVANVVMLGGLLGAGHAPALEALETTVRTVIGKRRPELVEQNVAALHAGRDAAREQLLLAAL